MKLCSIILRCARATIVSGAATAAAAACGGAGEASPDTPMDPPPSTARQEACPLGLSGATSSTEDTVDGVVVTFSTPRSGDRPELLRRVQRLADLHNSMRGGAPVDESATPPQGPGPTTTASAAAGDATAAKGSSGAESGGALDSKAAAESGEEGAVRLVIRPREPARLDSMRDHLRAQADELVQQVCDQAGRKALH